MADPLLRDALRIIQDIVAQASGARLDGEALRRIESVLARLVGAEHQAGPDSGFSERDATVLFADLRGFSAISAAHPPDVVLGLLGRSFARMSEIATRHYGTIDKFIGDAIMVVFHGDDPASPRDHAQRAVLCAVEMQIGMHELRQRHREAGLPDIHIGIGVASGKVMAGLIGSDAYRTFTVMGEVVNLAARIETVSLRGQVLISETTYRHCAEFVRAGEPMSVHVKGQTDGVPIREVLAIPELGKTVPRQDLRKSPRVEIDLDLEYWAMAGKVVDGGPLRGMVRNIGYHGLLAALAEPLPLYSEVRLAFDLPRLGFRAADVYARVVSVRPQSDHYLAGLEFTSLGAEATAKIPHFVQLSIQAEVSE